MPKFSYILVRIIIAKANNTLGTRILKRKICLKILLPKKEKKKNNAMKTL